jgi:hypothetical protein
MNPQPADESADSDYRNLYKLGGAAALIAAVLTLCEAVVLALHPQPGPVREWFQLLQSNPIIGWLDLWGLEVPLYVMFIPMFLALYIVLRKTDPGFMLIALAAGLLGIGIFFATNNPLAIFSLSRQYAAAATDAERSVFLAAGQALLASTNQRAVGGFNMGLFLVSAAGLIVSWVMVRSGAFGKSTVYAGFLANALSLADFLRAAWTPSKIAALIVILPNVLLLTIWFFSVGRGLIQGLPGREPPESSP